MPLADPYSTVLCRCVLLRRHSGVGIVSCFFKVLILGVSVKQITEQKRQIRVYEAGLCDKEAGDGSSLARDSDYTQLAGEHVHAVQRPAHAIACVCGQDVIKLILQRYGALHAAAASSAAHFCAAESCKNASLLPPSVHSARKRLHCSP
jgi:hypothetical protein